MVLKSFLYSFSSYLPVIRRHLQITSFSADIICMCTFRIFALKYGAKSTHIAVCDTRKGIFDILSSFLFCGRCYLWRSHTAPTLPDRSCFCILHWSRAVPSRHWCMASKMHQQNRRLNCHSHCRNRRLPRTGSSLPVLCGFFLLLWCLWSVCFLFPWFSP